MIYIVTAIYAEAQPFITRFQLKKESFHTRFQVFLNKEADLCLIISGTGSVPAAVAVSSICTEYGAGRGDFLLNAGICAQIRRGSQSFYRTENPSQTGHPCQTENPCRTGQIFSAARSQNRLPAAPSIRIFYTVIRLRKHRS